MAIETLAQFQQRIIDQVDADIDELPRGMSAAWFNNPDTGKPTIFTAGDFAPFDRYSKVVAIFQDPTTIRVYTLPAQPPTPPDPNWQARQPTRYLLSKAAPTYVAEIMSLSAAADAIADEWNELAGPETPDDELAAVIDFLVELPPVIQRDELVRQLSAGEHRDDEGDGDDDEDDKPAEAPAAASQPS